MKKEKKLLRILENLNKTRRDYISFQIKLEKGFEGFLFKIRLKKLKDEKKANRFLVIQNKYYEALKKYRKFLIDELIETKKRATVTDLKVVVKLTIFDEIKKLRNRKEESLRSKGIKGIIRTQVQEWRSISTGFKLGLGFVVCTLGVFLSFTKFNIEFLQIFLLGSGAIIFLEGAQQRITKKRADKKGMNRFHAFRRAKSSIEEVKGDVLGQLQKIHSNLEEEIWEIRVREKRTEYRRYIVALMLGAFIGTIPIIPQGAITTIKMAVSSIFSRFVWFFLPYGAMRNSFFDFFKAPTAEAADDFEELDVGEGSAHLEEYVSRAPLDDPTLVAAKSQELVNPFIKQSNLALINSLSIDEKEPQKEALKEEGIEKSGPPQETGDNLNQNDTESVIIEKAKQDGVFNPQLEIQPKNQNRSMADENPTMEAEYSKEPVLEPNRSASQVKQQETFLEENNQESLKEAVNKPADQNILPDSNPLREETIEQQNPELLNIQRNLASNQGENPYIPATPIETIERANLTPVSQKIDPGPQPSEGVINPTNVPKVPESPTDPVQASPMPINSDSPTNQPPQNNEEQAPLSTPLPQTPSNPLKEENHVDPSLVPVAPVTPTPTASQPINPSPNPLDKPALPTPVPINHRPPSTPEPVTDGQMTNGNDNVEIPPTTQPEAATPLTPSTPRPIDNITETTPVNPVPVPSTPVQINIEQSNPGESVNQPPQIPSTPVPVVLNSPQPKPIEPSLTPPNTPNPIPPTNLPVISSTTQNGK